MWKYFLILFLMGCGVSKETYPSYTHGFFSAKNSGEGGIQIFGDSIFATQNHRIKAVLEPKVKAPIKDRSVTGAWTKEITEQYRKARGESVKVAIRDGGGNDVFGNSGDCKAFNDRCKKVIEDGIKSYEDFFAMAQEDGVHSIILLGFHYPQGWNGGYEKAIDYTYPLLAKLCKDSVVPCRLVDPREKFKSTGGLLEWDGIHPNAEGGKVLAEMIFEKFSEFDL